MLTIAAPVWGATLDHFRRCGAGRRECVAYWVGPANQPGVVDRVAHPEHEATVGFYQVHEDWLHSFWLELALSRESVRAQVHTHAGEAFHSPIDDGWPIVHTPGFLSLVIPNFATEPVAARDLYLAEIGVGGRWRQVDVDAHLGGDR